MTCAAGGRAPRGLLIFVADYFILIFVFGDLTIRAEREVGSESANRNGAVGGTRLG